MPAALPTNRAVGNTGHVNDTNTMHEFRNRVVSVGRGVIFVDPTNGSDSNDGFSMAYAKQTLAAAEAAVPNGGEIRCMRGIYNFTTGVKFTDREGIRLLGEGGLSRNSTFGARFFAQTNGMDMLTFDAPAVTVKEGPEIANISFRDSTAKTARLLVLSNQNRWQIQRCDFWGADVGLRIEEDFAASGHDNAWNVITGGSHFSHCRIGLHYASGNGFRDYGSEFTACDDLSADIAGQHSKFFGSFFDGQGKGGIRIGGNNNNLIGCKFEAIYLPSDLVALRFRGGTGSWASIGNGNKALFCSFGGYGSLPDQPSAYFHVESGARFTWLIGNNWVQGGNWIVDNGQATVKWNVQDLRTYSASNTTTTRSFNTNSTTTGELANVVGTLIADLRSIGLVE